MAVVPSSTAVSARMQRQRTTGTDPELALRRALHTRGLRYRVNRAPVRHVRSRPDIVFGPAKVAVFVDGCFWHRCPAHGTIPASNRDWWLDKLERNVERDRRTDALLDAAGWTVIRVWEHEDVTAAADHIEREVRTRQTGGDQTPASRASVRSRSRPSS
ncbi:MAG TPA: very short patch repair endonuclease [Baekduia sp.]|nr:very short patch repair endonuclease [Baekduia sp.]HMJ34972.1 very short patch repair endonuclease [Baekduia sp.]